MGSVLQINISHGGVPKLPIPEGEVTRLGIIGDVQIHTQFHGGPTRALLLITSEGIDELKAQGFGVYPGAMGENITTQGIDRHWMRVGQRYRIGDVIIELMSLREPCSALTPYGKGIQKAVYVEDGEYDSPRWGLGGFYASVIRTGRIRAGDPIELLEELA